MCISSAVGWVKPPASRQTRVTELQSREEEALKRVAESLRLAEQAQLEKAEAHNTSDTLRRYGSVESSGYW